MALMAVCPSCGVENSPMNTACDMCKAPLGVALVEGATETKTERTPPMWMAISAGITAGLATIPWIANLHPVTIAVAMFYGPLVASYRARANVVWHAALGGVLGLLALVVLSMILSFDETQAMLASVLGGGGARHGVIMMLLMLLGVAVLLATILPVSLVGASVGEHLAVHRRRPAPPRVAPAAPARLSDAELARVEL